MLLTVKKKNKSTLKHRLFNDFPKDGRMYHPLIDSFPHILLAATAFLQHISLRGNQKARIILTISTVLEAFLLASKTKSPAIRLVTGQSTIAKEFFDTMIVKPYNS